MQIPGMYIKDGKINICNVSASRDITHMICMCEGKQNCSCKHNIPHISGCPLRECTDVICAQCEGQSYQTQGYCTPCKIPIFDENFIPIGSVKFR